MAPPEFGPIAAAPGEMTLRPFRRARSILDGDDAGATAGIQQVRRQMAVVGPYIRRDLALDPGCHRLQSGG